jgi:hypothetical protein
MNAYEEADDKIVRQINRTLNTGWTPTANAWVTLGAIIARRQEARDQPIWGMREMYMRDTQTNKVIASKPVARVANAWAFHPLATPIRDVTYDEAIALHKLKN